MPQPGGGGGAETDPWLHQLVSTPLSVSHPCQPSSGFGDKRSSQIQIRALATLMDWTTDVYQQRQPQQQQQLQLDRTVHARCKDQLGGASILVTITSTVSTC